MANDIHVLNWLEATYEETYDLLREVKNYHDQIHPGQCCQRGSMERYLLTCESLRITSRLSHIMAWLLNEKAVLAEEMSCKEARTRFRPLCEENICTKNRFDDLKEIPRPMSSLMERSHLLFMRASRIEHQLRKEAEKDHPYVAAK